MDSILEKENVPFPQKSDRELLEEMQERIVKMEKRARRNAIFAWGLTFVIFLALVLTVISLVPQINVIKAQREGLMENVQQLGIVADSIDVETLQEAIEFVGSIDYAKMMELSEVLETMDAQQLRTQLEQITALLNEVDELNTEALIDNINLIIEKLQPVMNWLR